LGANGEPDGGRKYAKRYCKSLIMGHRQIYIFNMPSSRAGSYFFLIDEKVSKKSRLLRILWQNYLPPAGRRLEKHAQPKLKAVS